MKGRKPSPDELKLWHRVAKSTDRLLPEPKRTETMAELLDPVEPSRTAPNPVPAFSIGQKARSLPGISKANGKPAIHMDKRAYDKLKRGKLKPQGRIDLHGMTLDQAHPALTAFIMSSFAKERRLVLVITGKGQGKTREDVGPIPERPGILRRNVPHWLQSPPLAQLVLQVTEAHGRHGGGGAFYVYLRRGR